MKRDSVKVPIWDVIGPVDDGTSVGWDGTGPDRVTVVTIVSGRVLYFQGPLALRLLIPGVCGHKRPVVESLRGEVIGPERNAPRAAYICVGSSGAACKGRAKLQKQARARTQSV